MSNSDDDILEHGMKTISAKGYEVFKIITKAIMDHGTGQFSQEEILEGLDLALAVALEAHIKAVRNTSGNLN